MRFGGRIHLGRVTAGDPIRRESTPDGVACGNPIREYHFERDSENITWNAHARRPQRRVAPSTPYPRDTSPRDSESSELAETHTGHSVATQSYEELAEFKTILSDVSDPSAHRAMMRAAAAEAAQPRTSSPAPPASKARRWTSFLPSFGSFKKTFSPPPAPRARRSFHG
mmetsp:Transcript_19758/g.60885  ORF Transcript_19758/g.60885 Transcript_19758/m.60885 type:complete len:169 (+) Transcript_19758:677-1183(+)